VNKNHSIDDQIIQKACVQMEVADRSNCPEQVTNFDVLKSTETIPKTIELHQTDGIIRVAPVDNLARRFSYVPLERAQFGGNGRFNDKIIFAFRYNNYLFLTSKRSSNYMRYIRYIMVYGLFENPEDLISFTHIDGDACYSDNDDYPLNNWMWNYMKAEILKAEFQTLVAAPTDEVNDGRDQVTSNVEGER
jgi:hypothetical protein